MERRFSVLVGDITVSRAQAIVNASDEALSGGGGVDAAIHAAAGPELAAACAALAPCPTGEVRLTPGFRLAAEYVIHTAGPVWQDGKHGEPALLAACYRNALRLCEERGIETVDFPSISTGVFRYPAALAAAVAEKTIVEHLRAHALPDEDAVDDVVDRRSRHGHDGGKGILRQQSPHRGFAEDIELFHYFSE